MGGNPDFKDLFRVLNESNVRYLVGAYAVIYHTEPRYTKDLDVWVEPSPENAARVWKALADFAAPLHVVTREDFTNPDIVFHMGREPNRVAILTSVADLTFEKAWKRRVRTSYDDQTIYVLNRLDLIRNKKAAGRPQDLLDAQKLIDWARFKPHRKRRQRS